MNEYGEVIIYQTDDGLTKLNVSLQNETVWLTIDQMAELFQRDKSTISRHIHKIANEVVDAYDVAESLADAYESEQREQQELLQRNICKAKNRLETLERMTTKAYEDLLTETITEPMFNSLVERTKKESEDLMKQIAHDERRLAKNGKNDGNARKWIDLIKDYADITELDADTLNRLIKQIVVHEEITEDGTRNISMEIHYNFRPTDESKTYNLSEYAEANSVAEAI